jgi:hypothetical protein
MVTVVMVAIVTVITLVVEIVTVFVVGDMIRSWPARSIEGCQKRSNYRSRMCAYVD